MQRQVHLDYDIEQQTEMSIRKWYDLFSKVGRMCKGKDRGKWSATKAKVTRFKKLSFAI